jgi:hypothetical protein
VRGLPGPQKVCYSRDRAKTLQHAAGGDGISGGRGGIPGTRPVPDLTDNGINPGTLYLFLPACSTTSTPPGPSGRRQAGWPVLRGRRTEAARTQEREHRTATTTYPGDDAIPGPPQASPAGEGALRSQERPRASP